MSTVRSATIEDREVVLRTIERAFEQDPLLRFFFPSDERYATAAPVFFGFIFDLDLEDGEILVAKGGAAVSLWEPPRERESPQDDELERRWDALVVPSLLPDEQGRIGRFEAAATAIAVAGPHRYLGVLATDPDHRGRGLARSVLDPVFARDDADGTPAHLQTCTPENLPFYERFGFTVHAATTIEDGPRLWELVRSPADTA